LNRQILSQAVPNQNRIKIDLNVKNPVIFLICINKLFIRISIITEIYVLFASSSDCL